MALILSIGSDPALMQSRQLVLEIEGHTVIGVMDEKALAAACELHSFDVAILSQTLSPKMKQHIVYLIREHCPRIKVLELFSIENGHALNDADSRIAVPGVPQELAEHVTALAKAN